MSQEASHTSRLAISSPLFVLAAWLALVAGSAAYSALARPSDAYVIFTLTVVAVFLFLVGGLIAGIWALIRIGRRGSKLGGKWLAILGVVLALISGGLLLSAVSFEQLCCAPPV